MILSIKRAEFRNHNPNRARAPPEPRRRLNNGGFSMLFLSGGNRKHKKNKK